MLGSQDCFLFAQSAHVRKNSNLSVQHVKQAHLGTFRHDCQLVERTSVEMGLVTSLWQL